MKAFLGQIIYRPSLQFATATSNLVIFFTKRTWLFVECHKPLYTAASHTSRIHSRCWRASATLLIAHGLYSQPQVTHGPCKQSVSAAVQPGSFSFIKAIRSPPTSSDVEDGKVRKQRPAGHQRHQNSEKSITVPNESVSSTATFITLTVICVMHWIRILADSTLKRVRV